MNLPVSAILSSALSSAASDASDFVDTVVLAFTIVVPLSLSLKLHSIDITISQPASNERSCWIVSSLSLSLITASQVHGMDGLSC